MGNDEFGRWLGGCGGRRSVRPPPQMTCPFICWGWRGFSGLSEPGYDGGGRWGWRGGFRAQ